MKPNDKRGLITNEEIMQAALQRGEIPKGKDGLIVPPSVVSPAGSEPSVTPPTGQSIDLTPNPDAEEFINISQTEAIRVAYFNSIDQINSLALQMHAVSQMHSDEETLLACKMLGNLVSQMRVLSELISPLMKGEQKLENEGLVRVKTTKKRAEATRHAIHVVQSMRDADPPARPA